MLEKALTVLEKSSCFQKSHTVFETVKTVLYLYPWAVLLVCLFSICFEWACKDF